MQDYELAAWLGDDWTPEQAAQITADFRDWQNDYPDADAEETEAVLVAICQHRDDSLDIAALADADRQAQTAANTARRALRAAAVVRHRLAGIDQSETARQAGVTRMTARKWLDR